MSDDLWSLHAAAVARGDFAYTDPQTGFAVFTELGLRARGKCCGCGCRHCPFEHENVPARVRASRIQRPAVLTGRMPGADRLDVVFWSGGKDSLLALRALRREAATAEPVLLTTFDALHRQVAHQEIGIAQVVRQAEALGLPLVGVPLHPGRDYLEQVEEGLALIPSIGRLVFGDLHLEHVREWRETQIGPIARAMGATLHYPLWGADYDSLLDDLEASGVPCEVCAVPDEQASGVSVGERFGRALTERLPAGVDRFGECGEFHTLARIWDAPADSADLPGSTPP